MTIERTREILGEDVSHLTDDQVEQLISDFSSLADLLADFLLQSFKNNANNKLKT